jgi:hypothetical protein
VAARALIPRQVIEKKKVGFFSHAVGRWFDSQAERVVGDYLLRPDPAFAEILEPAAVEDLVKDDRSARTWASSGLLLSILMLEIWLSTFLPRARELAEASGTLTDIPA